MRKNKNVVTISGRIFEHTLVAKVSEKGVPFIGGEIKVAVDEEGLNVIPVTFVYVAETYGNTGKVNKNYGILQQIINSAKTWKADGKDEATKVKIDGNININAFVGRDNQMVEAMRNEGSFITIIKELPEIDKRATFSVDIIIKQVAEKLDAEGESLGYDVVGGRIFAYPNKAIPVTFTVRNPAGIKYFEGLDASPENLIYTNVRGNIEAITTIKKIEEENAFGPSTVREIPNVTKAWVIDAANPVPFDFGEETMTEADIQTTVQAYEVYLAEQRKNYDDYQAKKNGAPAPAATSAVSPAQKAKFANF